MNNSASLTIVATAIAVARQEDQLRAAQEKLVTQTIKEKGCLRYELHQSIDDPRILTFIEIWASETDWHTHMQGEAIREFQSSGAGKLIAEFSLEKMVKVAG